MNELHPTVPSDQGEPIVDAARRDAARRARLQHELGDLQAQHQLLTEAVADGQDVPDAALQMEQISGLARQAARELWESAPPRSPRQQS